MSEVRIIGPATRDPIQPILQPRQDDAHWWERKGTFNPGITEYGDNIVMLYRAYDDFNISRFGLAVSEDGINFERFDLPAIDTDPDDPFERMGIEDPRITKLDDTYYIVHTSASYYPVGHAADVHGAMEYIPWRVRIGMRATKDFKSFFNYRVVLPDVPAKNGTLLPEKINDSFALLYREHTEHEEILKLALTKDFRSWESITPVAWPKAEKWQETKFGLGSQPIATPDGFLAVYHAVDANQVYRLGVLLFDRKDPTKIVWHSGPVLEPQESFEREGFAKNVVYCCGAIKRGNSLWIYYGGGDGVIARAVLSLKGVL